MVLVLVLVVVVVVGGPGGGDVDGSKENFSVDNKSRNINASNSASCEEPGGARARWPAGRRKRGRKRAQRMPRALPRRRNALAMGLERAVDQSPRRPVARTVRGGCGIALQTPHITFHGAVRAMPLLGAMPADGAAPGPPAATSVSSGCTIVSSFSRVFSIVCGRGQQGGHVAERGQKERAMGAGRGGAGPRGGVLAPPGISDGRP